MSKTHIIRQRPKQAISRFRPHGFKFGVVAVCVATLVSGACSSTASNLLSTGSILPTSQTSAAPAAPAVTPLDRTVQVAAVSARAQKCGYVFSPGDLKANYLAFETAQGGTPEAVASLGPRYDFTKRRIASRISADPNYCDDARTAQIKADLNRHLAGDFTPRKVRRGIEKAWYESDTTTRTEINPDFGRGTGDEGATREVKVEE